MNTDTTRDPVRARGALSTPPRHPAQTRSPRVPRERDSADSSHPLISTFTQEIHTRVATTLQELEAAAELVRRRYAWRGYDCDVGVSNDERGLTLVTSERDRHAGTMTLRCDSTSGLNADAGFGRELDAARRLGHRLGEVTRLALEAEANSKAILASLFYVGHWIFRFHHGVTHVVIEVNPRHATFYRRAMGFVVASGERICERVGAPAVLLRAPIDVIGQHAALLSSKVLDSLAAAVEPASAPAAV